MVAFKMSPRFAAPSQNFEKNMSGDAMRNCLSSEQENVGSNMSRPQQPKQVALPMFGGSGQQFAQPFAQPEYPKPGSEATCDSCGTVVTRFFHCQDCQEDVGGLFDLCPGCWYAHRCRQSHRALLASPLSYAHMMCYP